MTGPQSLPVPPRSVLDAFGVEGDPVPLAEGQGRSVLVGGYVFKPAEGADDHVEWVASVYENLPPATCQRFSRAIAASGR